MPNQRALPMWWRASPSSSSPRSSAARTSSRSASAEPHRDHDVRARLVAQHPNSATHQRFHHQRPAFGQLAAQPAQVPAQVTVAGQLHHHELAGGCGADAGASRWASTAVTDRWWRHHPADAEGRGEDLAGRAEVHHHVRGQRGQQRQRCHVVAQLAVVVVLDHQPALLARPLHQRDPAARGHAAAQRVLVGGRAVHGTYRSAGSRPPAGRRRRRSPVRPAGPRPAARRPPAGSPVPPPPPRRRGAAPPGPAPRPPRWCRPWPARTSLSPTRSPRCRSRCSATAARYSGRPARFGRTIGGTCDAARHARRHAACSMPLRPRRARGEVDGGVQPGVAAGRFRGRRQRAGRRGRDVGARPVPARDPALGVQLLVGGGGHRPADAQLTGERAGRRQPVAAAEPCRRPPRRGAVRRAARPAASADSRSSVTGSADVSAMKVAFQNHGVLALQ